MGSMYVQEVLELEYAGSEAPARTRRRSARVGRRGGAGEPARGALPPELRPRERLLDAGAGALSAAELLAVVLGGAAADRGSLDLAHAILSGVPEGGLAGLRGASLEDLTELPGVGEAKAVKILVAVELGKRLSSARGAAGRPAVSGPADVHAVLRDRLSDLDREHFVCLVLNTKNEVVASPTVAVGTLSSCLVHPREVFKPAIKASAAFVILAHNHPSGQTRPSNEDRAMTKRLAEAGETLGIEVLDHVIFGNGYLSLKEAGLF